ncbi:MAG: hypothetical protein KGQ42_07625, partial [Alphaproteobacteria bacterium]|nr:hypothetical protein [Alphaproteobacteria bacterium]
MMTDGANHWWDTRMGMALLLLLAALPLLWPPVPPLVDLPGHLGQYTLMLANGHDPALARYYSFHWRLIGNLGVEGLVWALGPLIGLEPAVKLIILLIPVLTVAGIMAVARSLYGRVPPVTLFALPFAYSFVFQYGFVNYCLAQALALLLFAVWLRTSRDGVRWPQQLALVPLDLLLWLVHMQGWLLLGMMIFSASVVQARQAGAGWGAALIKALIACLPLALPVFVMLYFILVGHGNAPPFGWFNMPVKLLFVLLALLDHWQMFDVLCMALVLALLLIARRIPGLRFNPLALSIAAACAFAVIILPFGAMSGANVDTRFIPVTLSFLL